MEALFFGESDSQLYGVYHAPGSGDHTNRALLMCYPAGHEYLRIHRCYRQIASQLNDLGFHVLRFDYFGTGDSAGDHDDISAERWVSDTLAAMDELRSISGVRKIDVLGARFGGLIAANACAQDKQIRELLLWDPCLSGASFVAEMRDELVNTATPHSNFIDQDHGLNFNGYRFSESGLTSLEAAVYPAEYVKTPRRLSVIGDSKIALGSQPLDINHSLYDGRIDWNGLDAIGGLFLPSQAVKEIVDILSATNTR